MKKILTEPTDGEKLMSPPELIKIMKNVRNLEKEGFYVEKIRMNKKGLMKMKTLTYLPGNNLHTDVELLNGKGFLSLRWYYKEEEKK